LLYFLTGTTGSGKSEIAHQIALSRNIKILSLDSMSVYKNLNILSDKPTDDMQKEVHYFGLNIVQESENFSVFDYLMYLSEIGLDKLSHKEDIIAVGGTGLYFNAIVKQYSLKNTDKNYRKYLENLDLITLQSLYNSKCNSYSPIDMNNKRRLIRSLESKNQTISKSQLDFNIPKNKVGVFWDNPDTNLNIQKRTAYMMNNGLIDEVKNISNPNRTVMQAIGFKEIINLNDNINLIEEINRKTYKLVKKQRTWFKKVDNIIFLKTNRNSTVRLNMERLIDER